MMARVGCSAFGNLGKFLSGTEKPQEYKVTVQPYERPFQASFTDIENRFPLTHNLEEQMQRSNKNCGVLFWYVLVSFWFVLFCFI